MKIERFEDILAWQKSQDFAVSMYGVLKNCKDFGFRDQLQRAAVSISNNIAEGFERRGDKQLKYFLFIAKGSCGEVRSMLYLGRRIGIFSETDFNKFLAQSEEVSKILSGFISKLS